MSKRILDCRKAPVAAADASSHVAHLHSTKRRLPRDQFGDQVLHGISRFLEDETIFFKGSVGVNEAEVEIEVSNVDSWLGK